MSLEYSHRKSESLAQISTPMAEIQNFFLEDCFFLGAPCIYCRSGGPLSVCSLNKTVKCFSETTHSSGEAETSHLLYSLRIHLDYSHGGERDTLWRKTRLILVLVIKQFNSL